MFDLCVTQVVLVFDMGSFGSHLGVFFSFKVIVMLWGGILDSFWHMFLLILRSVLLKCRFFAKISDFRRFSTF